MKNNIFVLNEDFFDDDDIDVNVKDNSTEATETSSKNIFGIYTEADLSPVVWVRNADILDFKMILKRIVGILSERVRIFDLTGPVSVEFIFNPNSLPTMGAYIEHNMEIPQQEYYTYKVDLRDSNNNINTNIFANVIAGLKERPNWESANEDTTFGSTLGILFKIPCVFVENCTIEKFMDDMIIVFCNIQRLQTYLRSMCSPHGRRS